MPHVGGYDLAARNRPARQCGGDYYEALMVPSPGGPDSPGRLRCGRVRQGDAGRAADEQHEATLRALIGRDDVAQRAGCTCQRPAARIDVAEQIRDRRHAGTETPATGAARYVSAGHAECLLLKANGDAERLESTGTPLGLMGAGQPYTETDVRVEPRGPRRASIRTASPTRRTRPAPSSARSACWRSSARTRRGRPPAWSIASSRDRPVRRRSAAVRRHHHARPAPHVLTRG